MNTSPCMEKSIPGPDCTGADSRSGTGEGMVLSPVMADNPSIPVTMPLECTVFGPEARPDGFTALQPEWNRLLARSRFDTLFLTYEWQTTWWQELGEGELWILAFRQTANGELVGIVPLYRLENRQGRWAGQDTLHLVGCIEVSDYLDAIVARGWEDQVYAALLRWLVSSEAPHWDVLDLCNLPEESLTYHRLPEIFRKSRLIVEVSQEDVAPYIPLPFHYIAYLQERVDKKQRHEIRRKQRRAEREAEIDFYFVGEDDDLDRAVDDFITLHRLSRPDKDDFMTPEMQRFFRALAWRMLRSGYLRLSFLNVNGQRAAAYWGFEYERQMLLYNSGYNTDDLAHLSPGWVLLAYLIQHAITVGCQSFDFLQGNEDYKYRFGGVDRRVMRVLVYNR